MISLGLTRDNAKDERPQAQKEDPWNFYHSDQISTLDILHALEMGGIRISRFVIGEFNKPHQCSIRIDEFIDGRIVRTEEILSFKTIYTVWDDENRKHEHFLDQFKIFTRTDVHQFEIGVRTYNVQYKKTFEYKKKEDKQFFIWRNYSDTEWKPDQKIPLMVFASSWYDKSIEAHRFCGASELKQNDKDTEELLSLSPNYFVIYYEIKEIDEKSDKVTRQPNR